MWAGARTQNAGSHTTHGGTCTHLETLLHGSHQMFTRRTEGRHKTRDSSLVVGPKEGRSSTVETQTSPRSSSPSAPSTKAPATGDKAGNLVTLRAPAETQCYQEMEKRRKSVTPGSRLLARQGCHKGTIPETRAQRLPKTKAEPEQEGALLPPSSNTHSTPASSYQESNNKSL